MKIGADNHSADNRSADNRTTSVYIMTCRESPETYRDFFCSATLVLN